MKAQYKAIFEVFYHKYGIPNLEHSLPEWHATKKGYWYLVSLWKIGSKNVELRVEDNGVYYYLQVVIYQPAIEEKIKNEKIEKEKESAKKAVDII